MISSYWKADQTQLIIFDWDGTLVDSCRVIVETLQSTFKEAGIRPPPVKHCQQVIGLGLQEALEALAPEAEEGDWQRIKAIYSRRFQATEVTRMPFFPGVWEGLRWLRARGQLLGVATGKSRCSLAKMLREWRMQTTFHTIRCADETASKPNPRMLLEMLQELGLEPEQAVLVGDTAFDMEMAYWIGLPRLAVTYGVHSPEQLAQWRPDAWAEDFGQVMGHLGFHYLDRSAVESYN